jgi:hypothetical protein
MGGGPVERPRDLMSDGSNDSELKANGLDEPNDPKPVYEFSREVIDPRDHPLRVLELDAEDRAMNRPLWGSDALAMAGRFCLDAAVFAPRRWQPRCATPGADIPAALLHLVLQRLPVLIAGSHMLRPAPGPSKPKAWKICLRCAPEEIWTTAGAAVTVLRRHYATKGISCEEVLTPGAIYLFPQELPAVMIVLRAFADIAEIVRDSAIPSDQIAYDGGCLYFSRLGLWAHSHLANIVDPERRSMYYERDLAAAFDDGFAIVLPRLRLIKTPGAMDLPRMTLHVKAVAGSLTVGEVSVTNCPARPPAPIPTSLNTDKFQFRYNIRSVLAGDGNFIVAGEPSRSLNYEKLAAEPPTLAYVLPRTELVSELGRLAKTAIGSKYVRWNILRDVFGLSPSEVAAMLPALGEEWRSTRLDATRAALLARYDVCPTAINWITGAVQTEPESSDVWYGTFFDAGPVVPAQARTEGLIAILNYHNTVSAAPSKFDNICACCQSDVATGGPNTATLSCGHVFHWEAIACPGLLPWLIRNETCPICRRPLSIEPAAG